MFPASLLGVPTLDALRDPLPHICFIAVGGIDSTNAVDFIAHGCAAVGVGSWLVAREDPAEASKRAGQEPDALILPPGEAARLWSIPAEAARRAYTALERDGLLARCPDCSQWVVMPMALCTAR